MSVLLARDNYKPFEYGWAFDAYQKQQQVHWLPQEVPLHNDVRDWNRKLTKEEQELLTSLFRFFVTADVDVASGYIDHYMPKFPKPELRMMMSAFAAMEAVHIEAYGLLIDTLGMPESMYQEFANYKEMIEKHAYLTGRPSTGLEVLAGNLAVFSGFSEGIQLYSTFAILLSFPRRGLLNGMGQIVTWSIRDESLHVESMCRLFRTLMAENPHVWTDDFKATIYEDCRNMVQLEDNFIDLCFKGGEIEGITSDEVKQYVRYLADHRLKQLGLKENYHVSNPLEWLEETLALGEHANFFEARATEYSKGALTGDWGDVWDEIDRK